MDGDFLCGFPRERERERERNIFFFWISKGIFPEFSYYFLNFPHFFLSISLFYLPISSYFSPWFFSKIGRGGIYSISVSRYTSASRPWQGPDKIQFRHSVLYILHGQCISASSCTQLWGVENGSNKGLNKF